MKKKKSFDYESFKKEAHKKLLDGDSLLGSEGALAPLLRDFLEGSLEGELDAHLEEESQSNRRNGKNKKAVKTSLGEIEVKTPRDRNSSFEPKILAKRETTLGVDIDRQILALYARGSSYSDIRSYLYDMYGLAVSETTIGRVTDKVLPLLQEWQSRSLEAVYPFVWMDAIHFKVREQRRVISKAVYCIIGVNIEGQKELLGLYLGESEGAKFWLQVLTDLQNRGVEDILIACIDNLSGFAEAVESIFPKTQVQLCIIHQVRNSIKYVASKDHSDFMKDLKLVYQATTIDRAELYLDKLEEKWGKKYPTVIRSWRRNWDRLTHYFQYDKRIRKVIYTTNIIEGFHRQLRKVTKTKGAFVNDNALMKLLYLVQKNITKKWDKPIMSWNQTLAQLEIIFEDRIQTGL